MKSRRVIIISVCLCVLLIVAGVFVLQQKEEGGSSTGNGENDLVHELTTVTLSQAKECFASDIQALKDGKYDNLIATDFTSSIDATEMLYHLEILPDKRDESRTYLEEFQIMSEIIDIFFEGKFDKSSLSLDIYYEDGGRPTNVSYSEVESVLMNQENPPHELGFLFGQMSSETDYFAQIFPGYRFAWFSKRTFDTSLPGEPEIDNECLYVTGLRQEDAIIHLLDKEIQLAELEKTVLDYVNGENFLLPIGDEIRYGIGTVHIMSYEKSECVNFVLRRIYKGVPFEYGSSSAGGEYIDEVSHDHATLNYAISMSPDTLMGFTSINDTIVEKEEITNILTTGDALTLLSDQIGENSVYEVYGVELVYRNCEIPKEREDVSEILTPKWKIITINQNDDKYTLFYVDVVTGDITERFEYYYD